VEEEKKDEKSEIKEIDIFYQIKVEYTGNGPYSVQVPVFIDENAMVLELNYKFKIIEGDVDLSINYTEHGPSLKIESSGSFCIELNESFQDKSEFTNNSAGLSLIEETIDQYWLHSTVPDEKMITLSMVDNRKLFDKDGVLLMESKFEYNGNIKYGWNVIKGNLYEYQKE
jgi:hypothetical protein